MATTHQLEVLSTALTAHQCAVRLVDSAPSVVTCVAETRAMNRLEGAAVACGMDRDHGDLSGWAAERVARWLMAA